MVIFINLEPFPQNFVANLINFGMGHAILTKLIGLVDKSLRMIYFSRKHKFLPFKLGFGSMTPKKRTLMATLQFGIDFKNVSLLIEIHIGIGILVFGPFKAMVHLFYRKS